MTLVHSGRSGKFRQSRGDAKAMILGQILSYRKLELAKMFCWRPALASNLRMHAPRTA